MFIVGIYYSFDFEMPMYIFETEAEAKEFIKKDFENEMKIQQECNMQVDGEQSDGFARILYPSGDFIEWNIGAIKNS
jgi:hypothetical protein